MLKALLGNSVVQFLVGRAIGLYMLLVGLTTRWTYVNRQAVEAAWESGDARFICCVWHGRFLQAHVLWRFGRRRPKAKFLISRSREGGIIAHAAQTVGVGVIRGSAAKRRQQKGGREATLEMVRDLESSGIVGMTPDGPRGPRMRAKMGAVQIARMTQTPLLPLAWSARPRFVANSWDRFMLPLPFGRGALVWGDPIAPPAPEADNMEMERIRAALETELNRITAHADRLAGNAIVEPAAMETKSAPEPASVAP